MRSLRRSLAAVALVVVVGACGDASEAGLPDVELRPIAGGEPISLRDIDGPAVVNLWATWCPPCRAEIPDFEAVHQVRGSEVRFVGVNVGEGADTAAAYLAEVGATYDQYLDELGYASTALRATTMPLTVVIDGDGSIVVEHRGQMTQDDLNAAIDEAIAG